MFNKHILKIQNNAKQRLQELRDKHLTETSELLATFGRVLKASTKAKETQDNAVFGEQVQSILDEHGGTELLLQSVLVFKKKRSCRSSRSGNEARP